MKTVFVQHLISSGDFLIEAADFDAAVESALSDWWPGDGDGHDGYDSRAQAREETAKTIREYTLEEVQQAHADGYGWPQALGLVHEE
jgi:hypothetical protein